MRLDDALADELQVNYLGVVAATQVFAPVLAANGGGAFVNVLSVSSWVSTPQLASYSASKAAAWAYSNAARIELKRQGTHVLGVHVGPVDTDLQAGNPVEKVPPAQVATIALDALEAGEPEALIDDVTRWVKASLADMHGLAYPKIESDYEQALVR